MVDADVAAGVIDGEDSSALEVDVEVSSKRGPDPEGPSTSGGECKPSEDSTIGRDVRDEKESSTPAELLSERNLECPSLGKRWLSEPLGASKSGGGCKSCLEADAYAIASAPYGRPNRANDSLEEIIFTCSGVGPDFG